MRHTFGALLGDIDKESVDVQMHTASYFATTVVSVGANRYPFALWRCCARRIQSLRARLNVTHNKILKITASLALATCCILIGFWILEMNSICG